MWKSFTEYILSLGRWIWIVLVDILLAITGAYLDISEKVGFPTWLWVTLLGIALVIAPFLSFHKLRKERDELKKIVEKKEQNKYAIAWVSSLVEWWLHITHGKTKYWDNENGAIGLILNGMVSVTTIGTIKVESIILDIGGQHYSSNWISKDIYTSENWEIEFEIPLIIQRGERTAHLIAIVDGKTYVSKPFTLNVPQYKHVFQKKDVK